MNSILEELYHGNLEVYSKGFELGSTINKALKSLISKEEKIINLLDEKEQALFQGYLTESSKISDEISYMKFSMGFKVGARITAEALNSEL